LEDDLPTNLGFGSGTTAPTAAPGGDEGDTEIPASRRASAGRAPDFDDEEETNLGRAAVEEDVTELEEVTTPVLGLLWAREGMRRGKYYPIKNGTVIGRKEGDLILDDPKVSGTHAKFRIENDQFVIWDMASANGTMVNGERIREATILEENDQIKIGESVFVIKLLDPKPKRTTPRRRASGKPAEKNPRKKV
jgi:hypothetical protein